MTSVKRKFNILWLQSGGCGGCTMSLLCAESPNLIQLLESSNMHFLWHPSISEETGAETLAIFEACLSGEVHLDALCVEGSLLRGPNGTGMFHKLSGTDQPMIAWVKRFAEIAQHVIAVGTCAAYGGITAAGSNPTDACGLQYDGSEAGGLLGEKFRSLSGLPVINVAGCPTHPNWVSETLLALEAGMMTAEELDNYGRPRMYADHLVHHGCPRNEYYEYKASAEKSSDLGCMMENMGCMGTLAHGDCNQRLWNGSGSCTRGGYACISCTEPGFEEPGHPFAETPKIAGMPIGLPTDMPKAWFVVLSSLAKSATPTRLKKNAVSDHQVIPPTLKRVTKK